MQVEQVVELYWGACAQPRDPEGKPIRGLVVFVPKGEEYVPVWATEEGLGIAEEEEVLAKVFEAIEQGPEHAQEMTVRVVFIH